MKVTRPIWWTFDTIESHPDWKPMYANKIDRNVGFALLHQSFISMGKYERVATYGRYSYRPEYKRE